KKWRLRTGARAEASPRSARPAPSAEREPAPILPSHTGAGTGTIGTLRSRGPCAPRAEARPGPPRPVRRATYVTPTRSYLGTYLFSFAGMSQPIWGLAPAPPLAS